MVQIDRSQAKGVLAKGGGGSALSVPWSLRPRNRAAAATAAMVAANIAAATEISGDVFLLVCDWYAGSPFGQCDGVQSDLQETRRENRSAISDLHSHRIASYLWLEGSGPMAEGSDSVGEFLAIFWRFSGDFFAAADPKLTCFRRGSKLSCLRCVFAQAFCCHKSFRETAQNFLK